MSKIIMPGFAPPQPQQQVIMLCVACNHNVRSHVGSRCLECFLIAAGVPDCSKQEKEEVSVENSEQSIGNDLVDGGSDAAEVRDQKLPE